MTVSIIHVCKSPGGSAYLDGHRITRISAFLLEGELDNSPQALDLNCNKAFMGSKITGIGFTFDDVCVSKGASSTEEMQNLCANNARNADRIFRYVGGEEVNSNPRLSDGRYIIDFEDFPLRRDPTLRLWSSSTTEEEKVLD